MISQQRLDAWPKQLDKFLEGEGEVTDACLPT